jgi:hypothetical protein
VWDALSSGGLDPVRWSRVISVPTVGADCSICRIEARLSFASELKDSADALTKPRHFDCASATGPPKHLPLLRPWRIVPARGPILGGKIGTQVGCLERLRDTMPGMCSRQRGGQQVLHGLRRQIGRCVRRVRTWLPAGVALLWLVRRAQNRRFPSNRTCRRTQAGNCAFRRYRRLDRADRWP